MVALKVPTISSSLLISIVFARRELGYIRELGRVSLVRVLRVGRVL